MLSQAGGFTSAIGSFLSWVVREHCVRNPDAVTKAWEQLSAEAPTLADAGRMFSAYGVDFTVSELRYIAKHPEALRLSRAVAAGRDHLEFRESEGFVAIGEFLPPQRGHIGRAAWVVTLTTVACLMATVFAAVGGSLQQILVLGTLTALAFFLTLVEFADLRSRHRARRAIELSQERGGPLSATDGSSHAHADTPGSVP